MAYCTKDDILNIISERELFNLTVDNPTEDSVVDEVQVSGAIDYADNCINGFLRGKYKLPLEVIPDFISKLCADIAVYRLYGRRPQSMPDHIKENYKMSLDLLNKIQKGAFLLDTAQEHIEGNMQTPKPTFLTNKTKENRIFNNQRLDAFGLGGIKR